MRRWALSWQMGGGRLLRRQVGKKQSQHTEHIATTMLVQTWFLSQARSTRCKPPFSQWKSQMVPQSRGHMSEVQLESQTPGHCKTGLSCQTIDP
mmetsp:Transcript_44210/g.77582  ORF Transcript_44210/g.77582 Transcript_44210/m.77582 type:complete len:94 (-) Transcript_44210:50-331(-)